MDKVTAWRTSDGRLFSDLNVAQRHASMLLLKKILEEDPLESDFDTNRVDFEVLLDWVKIPRVHRALLEYLNNV